MKSTRAIIMLALSVLAGLAAVLLAARWMGQQAVAGQTRVVVATHDLMLGQALTPHMLQEVSWPVSAQPEGAFTDAKQLEGRVVRSSIFKGEPILLPKLAPEGTKAGLDSVIKEGRRAITVKVNEVVGVAGFLAPGSYVDLLVNIREDGAEQKEQTLSRIVLERIMVLAVAQEANRGDEGKARVVNAVTLEVTPEEAEKIDLARNIGTLSLMLRNQVDSKDNLTAGARRQDLFARGMPVPAPVQVAAASPAPAKAAAPRKTTPKPKPQPQSEETAGVRIEVIRGVQKSMSEF